jgi:hypothetical protein
VLFVAGTECLAGWRALILAHSTAGKAISGYLTAIILCVSLYMANGSLISLHRITDFSLY